MYCFIFLLLLTFHQINAQSVSVSNKKDTTQPSISPHYELNVQDTSSNQKLFFIDNKKNSRSQTTSLQPTSTNKKDKNQEKKHYQLFQHNKRD